MKNTFLITILAAAVPSLAMAAAPPYSFRTPIYADVATGTAYDNFGVATALDGDTMVVGADQDAVGALTYAGSASVYVRVNQHWSRQQTVDAGTGAAAHGRFGQAVALDGDTIVVGAPGQNRAYVFTRSDGDWTLLQQLTSDATTGSTFGLAVAIDGDTIAVGAPSNSSNTGAVYTFLRTATGGTFAPQQKILAASGDYLGAAVALSGNTLVAGAPYADGQSPIYNCGAAYVFVLQNGSWAQQARLTAVVLESNRELGRAVAIQGDVVVAGAPAYGSPGATPGAAYVFTRTGLVWAQTGKLQSAEVLAATNSYSWAFASVVALEGSRVLVGAPQATYGGVSYAGAVYIFESGAEVGTLRARQVYARLGSSLATSSANPDELVAGARAASHYNTPTSNVPYSGAAYTYEKYFGKGDFDRDGATDLLMNSTTTTSARSIEMWLMNGTDRLALETVSQQLPTGTSQVAAVDDFDGDGENDILVWDAATGATQFWLMNGSQRISTTPLEGALPLPWKPSAAGDFDGDGRPDLVYRNFATQKLVVWAMSGTSKASEIIPSPDQALDGNWEIVAALDLNGDQTTDLLWYNGASGKIVQWTMTADVKRITGYFAYPAQAGANNWKVLAGGDYGIGPQAGSYVSKHSSNDLVWRNATSGRLVTWYMDFNGYRTGGVFVTPDPNTDWTIAGPR